MARILPKISQGGIVPLGGVPNTVQRVDRAGENLRNVASGIDIGRSILQTAEGVMSSPLVTSLANSIREGDREDELTAEYAKLKEAEEVELVNRRAREEESEERERMRAEAAALDAARVFDASAGDGAPSAAWEASTPPSVDLASGAREASTSPVWWWGIAGGAQPPVAHPDAEEILTVKNNALPAMGRALIERHNTARYDPAIEVLPGVTMGGGARLTGDPLVRPTTPSLRGGERLRPPGVMPGIDSDGVAPPSAPAPPAVPAEAKVFDPRTQGRMLREAIAERGPDFGRQASQRLLDGLALGQIRLPGSYLAQLDEIDPSGNLRTTYEMKLDRHRDRMLRREEAIMSQVDARTGKSKMGADQGNERSWRMALPAAYSVADLTSAAARASTMEEANYYKSLAAKAVDAGSGKNIFDTTSGPMAARKAVADAMPLGFKSPEIPEILEWDSKEALDWMKEDRKRKSMKRSRSVGGGGLSAAEKIELRNLEAKMARDGGSSLNLTPDEKGRLEYLVGRAKKSDLTMALRQTRESTESKASTRAKFRDSEARDKAVAAASQKFEGAWAKVQTVDIGTYRAMARNEYGIDIEAKVTENNITQVARGMSRLYTKLGGAGDPKLVESLRESLAKDLKILRDASQALREIDVVIRREIADADPGWPGDE